jgi:DNA-directed RNA polymerase subunit E"
MSQKACVSCKRISFKERCSVCHNPTSDNWSGFLIIIDPENSDVSKELGIELPGEFALSVR